MINKIKIFLKKIILELVLKIVELTLTKEEIEKYKKEMGMNFIEEHKGIPCILLDEKNSENIKEAIAKGWIGAFGKK